jgi:hypothetical protein
MRCRDFLAFGKIDLFERAMRPSLEIRPSPRPQVLCARATRMYRGAPIIWYWGRNSMANLVIDEARLDVVDRDQPSIKSLLSIGLWTSEVATLPAGTELLAIPGNVEDAIVQVKEDVLVLQGTATRDDRYVARRIGTTLAKEIARRLFTSGVDGLLDIRTQQALREAGMPVTSVGGQVIDRTNHGSLDFRGPYGTYFREIFFHIPLLLANHLSAQGRFAAARNWCHFVFDPTSDEAIAPPGHPLDRVWRYLELRNLDAATLRQTLTDPRALELHRREPFNPHAIARLRLSAYQKAVVQRYVENLLDWGDHLFTQFTMETVNEALALYRMASDILGPRPPQIGDCDEGDAPRTYETVRRSDHSRDALLGDVESWIVGRAAAEERAGSAGDLSRIAGGALARAIARVPRKPDLTSSTMFDAASSTSRPAAVAPPLAGSAVIMDPGRTPHDDGGTSGGTSPVAGLVGLLDAGFCFPPNRAVLDLWDRVEDRLYKIRHCQDITGQRRELALLAPEIDGIPAGLGRGERLPIDDGIAPTSGALPPYRFLYLIERAKVFAASLQQFGSSLGNALEKRDGEELARLRMVHQRGLASLSTRLREWDVDLAGQSLESVRRQREATEYRRDFFQSLLDNDRTGWEVTETRARQTAAGIRTIEATLGFLAATQTLLPQVGSPFAMKYGGVELGGSLSRLSTGTGMLATIADGVATSASMEGNYERRREGWTNQRDLAKHELRVLDQQLRSAEVRVRAAQRSLDVHTRGLEQIEEVLGLMESRFSSLGLFTWLAQQLQRLHRSAYENALALARLAEEAYRFERGADDMPSLAPSYWEAGRAGLLAGERLLVDLQTLERHFIETNHREHEVDQTFSASQIDPSALLALRETGECELEIPEFHFDLHYPGHYRRRIKSVRLTVPCITGPFVNVSATLELLASSVRTTPVPGSALVDVPPRRTRSIATSTAQNDGGVFELGFRDERYMPFEGAGAVSRWRITLPKTFRTFDYGSINDVILSISYTASLSPTLRQHVEQANAAIEGTLLHYVGNYPLKRAISLRQEASSAFTRLLHSPVGTDVKFELTPLHFPSFARGRTLHVDRALFLARARQEPTGLQLVVDGETVSGWQRDPSIGDLFALAAPPGFTSPLSPRVHTVAVAAAGSMAPDSAADPSTLDADKLDDIVVYLEYRLT